MGITSVHLEWWGVWNGGVGSSKPGNWGGGAGAVVSVESVLGLTRSKEGTVHECTMQCPGPGSTGTRHTKGAACGGGVFVCVWGGTVCRIVVNPAVP